MYAKKLGLEPVKIATQVVQRDRHAELLSTIAVVGGTLDKIALEIRHLQRTEVREAEEYFSPKQRVPPRCLINVILLHVKEFAVWLACFVATLNLLTKTKLCGMNAIFLTALWNVLSCQMQQLH